VAVFIELTTDAFEENFKRQLGSSQGGGDGVRSTRAGAAMARRPLRGIEIKEDTYAVIKVIRADGKEIRLFDSSRLDHYAEGYTNFIMQTVQEVRMEKHQIVETFGDNYIFFFGESPRFVDVTATLLNTHDFNWRAEWWANYNEYFRGTKLAEFGARLYLFYDDIILEGYLLHANTTETDQQPYHMGLNFRLFVTNYQNISSIGDANFPIRSSVVLPDNVSLTRGDAGADITTHFRGGAVDAANMRNAEQLLGGAQAVPLAAGSRISKVLQSVPASFAVSQGFWDYMFSNASFDEVFKLRRLITRIGNPLRGKITDNYDEYVGRNETMYQYILESFGFEAAGPHNTALKGSVQSQLESDDLFRDTIQFLACFGADVNNPDAMISLGLSASFGPGGATFGASASVRGPGVSAGAAVSLGVGIDGFVRDPLTSVYGSLGTGSKSFGSDRSKYTEGAGDPLYGYPSDFATGPGFGQAGFGDLGGFGFGSALGPTGDPGFKNPDKFTFAGVADNRSAFDRFLKPKEDPTAITFGVGLSAGTSGLSGGAGIAVGGKPTAFALISVPGFLDETGNARQAAAAIAAKQAQQKFGFSTDNPFGVDCPGSTADFGISEGFSASFP
jgi:hypothetical protein